MRSCLSASILSTAGLAGDLQISTTRCNRAQLEAPAWTEALGA
jgi:hypothetical protein